MAKNIRDFAADQRTALSGVLKFWIRANIRIAEEWNGKYAPWDYNERATLSVFAGAIWRCEGIAFEEYSDKKLYANRRGVQRKPYSGRCDINFKIRSTEFVAEAKYARFGASTGRDPRPRMKAMLDKAKNDAGMLESRGQCRLAIVFVAPYFQAKFKGDVEKMIYSWIEKIGKVECFAKAWVFPKASRSFKDREYFTPGVAVFIDEVRRATRA